jgi:hypothetical protein
MSASESFAHLLEIANTLCSLFPQKIVRFSPQLALSRLVTKTEQKSSGS